MISDDDNDDKMRLEDDEPEKKPEPSSFVKKENEAEDDGGISPLAAMAREGHFDEPEDLTTASEDEDVVEDDDLMSFSAIPDDNEMDEGGDDDGSLDFPDIDEDEMLEKKSGSAMKKFAAPLLVLALAGGVGAYIVMNPSLLGGGATAVKLPAATQSAQRSYTPPPVKQQPAAADRTAEPKIDTPSASVVTNSPRPPEPETVTAGVVETLPPPITREPPAASAPEEEPSFTFDETMPPAPKPISNDDGFGALPEPVSEPGFGETDMPAPPAPAFDTATAESSPAPVAAVKPEEEKTPSGTVLDIPEAEAFEAPQIVPDEDVLIAAQSPASSEPAMPSVNAANPEAAVPEQMAEDDIEEIEDIVFPTQVVADAPPSQPQEESKFSTTIETPANKSLAGGPSAVANVGGEDTYFDATTNVPTGPLATEMGPRKVNPVLEPAQKYVIVQENFASDDPESMLVSANRALKLKRYDAAMNMFQSLADKNDRDPRILMGLAVSQQNAGRDEAAMMTYEKLLDIDPDNTDAMVNMLGLLRKQYPSVAIRRLINLHEKYPHNAGIAAQIGILQADSGYYEEAMRYLGIASSLEPQNAQHLFNMAIIADRRGDKKRAVTLYQDALELDTVYGRGQTLPRETIYDRLAALRR